VEETKAGVSKTGVFGTAVANPKPGGTWDGTLTGASTALKFVAFFSRINFEGTLFSKSPSLYLTMYDPSVFLPATLPGYQVGFPRHRASTASPIAYSF